MGSPPHPQARLPASSNSSSLQDERSQFSLNIVQPQSSACEGSKEATIRDFFPSNRTSSRTRKVDARSSEGVIATQDLLQPLEHFSKPIFRNSVLSTGLADCLWVNNKNNHVGAEVIQFGHQDGTLELPNPGLNSVFGGVKGEKLLKMEWKTESKPLTPRSKHSATEQRRRCKINDRFQMLRQLVPYNDQKRDKASFLLEVVEYVQILQEKVRMYEATLHGREKESLRSLSWDQSQKNTGLHSTVADGLGIDSVRENSSLPIFSNRPDLKQAVDRSEQKMGGNESSESDCGRTAVRTSEAAQNRSSPVEAIPILTCNQVSSEKDHSLHQRLVRSLDFGYQDANSKACDTAVAEREQFRVASPSHTVSSDGAHLDGNPSKCEQNMTCAAQMKEPMLVHGGVISVSCLYSRKLLDALDAALQSSGLDLSQASISVQINLGKSAMTSSSLNVGLSTEGQRAPQELEGPSKRLKMGL